MLDDLAQADPPACGQTGTPNLAASSRLARFSFTPATRQASICMMSMASACSSCLNITRLETCSPVATLTGRTPRRIAAVPRMSSGAVGSSTQAGWNGASSLIQPIAVGTSQTWLASMAMPTSSPITSRAIAQRRLSSEIAAPTLSFT